MPTTYYVNNNTTSRGWTVAQTGTSTGDPLLGSGGFQRALNLVAAGDTIIVKGDVFASAPAFEQKYLGQVTTTNDKSATWLVGDAVQDNSTGLIWSGKILYFVSAKVIVVSLDVGVYADIATANGINNTTRTDTDTLSAKATQKFSATTTGTIAAAITITGGDASYNAGGGFFKLLGSASTTGTFYFSVKYYMVKYCISDANALAGMALYLNDTNNSFYRCYFGNGTSSSVYINSNYQKFRECIFATQSTGTGIMVDGSSGFYGFCQFICCKFTNSKGVALSLAGGNNIITGCLFHNSGRNAISFTIGLNNRVENCVIDGTGATYSGILRTASGASQQGDRYIFNRITNCAAYGIELSATDQTHIEDYNYFQSNSGGNLLNITAGANSIAGSDTNCGFVDPAYATSHDFRLAKWASLRRTAINMDWDLAAASQRNSVYVAAGLTPDDKAKPVYNVDYD
jgi:hypothetical protein